MSADNWAICPRCILGKQDEKEAQRVAAEEAYGKVSAAEYMSMHEEADKPINSEACRTFREDYEIGLSENMDGTFDPVVIVSYSGHCAECGLSIDFRDDRTLKL